MNLSSLKDFEPSAVIVRDSAFDSLGFDLRSPQAGMLTYAGNATFLRQAASVPEVSCILTTEKALEAFRRRHGEIASAGLALVASPRETFFRFHNHLCESTPFYRRTTGSSTGSGSSISRTAVVSTVSVRIGDRVTIGDHVVVHDNVTIGNDVTIGPGTILGGPGFQYLRSKDEVIHVRHAGGVEVGDGVSIHAACTIDRAIFGHDTTIGESSKLDNGVQFAHGSRIGRRGLIAARATICGSVRMGDDVWIGPGAVLSNNVVVGDRASVAIGAVVVRDVRDGESVAGNFAIDRDLFLERNLESLLQAPKP